jgi:SAM-dependent methyltransferase
VKSDFDYLSQHRQIWQSKAVLRHIYQDQIYAPIIQNLAMGKQTLEIGSGPGFMAEIEPSVIRSDILASPWIDAVIDAHHLPIADNSLDNVIGVDVLHHFNYPIHVLREVSRVLRVGGRFILVEPWITPFSRFIYTYLHQEECNLEIEPWLDLSQFDKAKNAFDGNAAIPYVLLSKGKNFVKESLPELRLQSLQPFSFITYLLSGGFKTFNLLPNFLYGPIYQVEKGTHPLWAKFASLRAVIIWEKQA